MNSFVDSKELYEKNLVEKFKKWANNDLYTAEKVFKNRYKDNLKSSKFLDIGIGCGRTTVHFINIVKEYYGIDYSENMIRNCVINNDNIFVSDAANMIQFKDNEFDIIMFSTQGIDCCEHDMRMKILKEINRTLKPGGLFIISSHNLLSSDPIINKIENLNYQYFYDYIHDDLLTYCVSPMEFKKQLKNNNFELIEIIDYEGNIIKDPEDVPKTTYWPYYISKKI